MHYIQLGGSELHVSRICLGGNSWGAAGRRAWSPFDADESARFFAEAPKQGVNFFDTAEGYNSGDSERIMGERLIAGRNRADLVIGTKAMLAASIKDDVRGHIVRTVEASLARLGTDYVDLFSVHRLDPTLPVEDVIAGLEDVVKAGKVRTVGASTMRPTQFARLVTLAKQTGVLRFVAMQNLHNLLYREEERDMNVFCVEEQISTTPYSPLARGVLSGARLRGNALSERAQKDSYATFYDRDSNTPIIDAVVALAAQRGVKPSQIALAWLLAKPAVGAAVIGATRIEHLADAAQATELLLTAEEIAGLEKDYVPTSQVFS